MIIKFIGALKDFKLFRYMYDMKDSYKRDVLSEIIKMSKEFK